MFRSKEHHNTRPTGKTLRFGEVVTDAAELPAPEAVTLKDPSEWKIIGNR
jgi:isoquinoline 1-oxidoreductase beta subunit